MQELIKKIVNNLSKDKVSLNNALKLKSQLPTIKLEDLRNSYININKKQIVLKYEEKINNLINEKIIESLYESLIIELWRV